MTMSMANRLVVWPFFSARTLNCFRRASHILSSASLSTAASAPETLEQPEPTPAKRPAASKFAYHLGAAYVSKHGVEGQFHRHGPEPVLKLDSGEDAFFISNFGNTGHHSFGVADGVAGCRRHDVDPADFSHGICHSMARFCSRGIITTPTMLLKAGYDDVCQQVKAQGGSSTACVAVAHPSGIVEVANLGDSGFLHLRPNAIIYRSKGQSHDFNTPFQLHCPKPGSGVKAVSDRPDDADVMHHSVRHGDILILATDGLLDNQYGHDILRHVSGVMLSSGAWRARGLGASHDLTSFIEVETTLPLQTRLARVLVLAARAASLSNIDGPFAKKVRQYDPEAHYFGGKPDDITVVVALVSEESADK
ncbi:protein serine/threonine phosphatase 2C [Ophiocordyceps camponoti-floridani]|uniref:Protein phosphatase n=1 Tax=Ophiocordyceps camponoti-floridani TaxID=2030778 RepID=A0A8H4Q369_9HYPO|nr:protein serine/threonine phosphatase 2C [Ophiocordyceps camponoti-floridani]